MAKNRNRTAGHNYERQIVNELKNMNMFCVTSRSESRNMDNKGIDIFGDELLHDIQCKIKKSISKREINNILLNTGRDEKDLVIFHKHVKRSEKGIFLPQGEFVYMKKNTYYNMIKQIRNG